MHQQAESSSKAESEYLTEQEAADVLRISTRSLQRWRHEGANGPLYRKFGGAVRYSRTELLAWASAQTFTSTSGSRVA